MSSIFSALRLSHDAAYYSTNGAFIVSYLLVRYAQPDSPVQRPSQYLAAGTTELDIGLAAVLLGFQKWRRCAASCANIVPTAAFVTKSHHCPFHEQFHE